MSVHEERAQLAAEEAVELLFAAEAEGECACVTCIVREALEASWPHLRAQVLDHLAADIREAQEGASRE